MEAIKAITRLIAETGLQNTILQSNGDPAILELLTELGRQLPQVKIQRHHSIAISHKELSNAITKRCLLN
eukprot:2526631-Amphidinium_carterae.2